MAAPDYDMMEEEEAPESERAEGESDGELDEEFLMHAEDAGFSGEKAKALKAAIERCVEMREQGMYEDMAEDMEEMGEGEA